MNPDLVVRYVLKVNGKVLYDSGNQHTADGMNVSTTQESKLAPRHITDRHGPDRLVGIETTVEITDPERPPPAQVECIAYTQCTDDPPCQGKCIWENREAMG